MNTIGKIDTMNTISNIGTMNNQELRQLLYNNFINERRSIYYSKKPMPLHLFSRRVYMAYYNAWRIINRKLLTQEENDVMLKLGIYKPTQTELGVRRLNKEERMEMCKIRLGVCE